MVTTLVPGEGPDGPRKSTYKYEVELELLRNGTYKWRLIVNGQKEGLPKIAATEEDAQSAARIAARAHRAKKTIRLSKPEKKIFPINIDED